MLNKLQKKNKSIAFMLMGVIVVLIFIQSLLLTGSFLVGGILNEARYNSYEGFSQVVKNRVNYLQGEMQNRWSDIDVYIKRVSEKLNLLNQEKTKNASQLKFFNEIEKILIEMMRTSMATDCFVILEDSEKAENTYPALYFRDNDIKLNDINNADICMLVGPLLMSKKYAAWENIWSTELVLGKGTDTFYKKPYEKAHMGGDLSDLGYWSRPFTLLFDTEPIISYSFPLMDEEGEVYGVIGIGILISQLKQYLPASELAKKDSIGYIMGYNDGKTEEISTMVSLGAYQKRILKLEEPLKLKSKNKKNNIYLLENHNSNHTIYACVEPLRLYKNNTLFENETWYLIGFKEKENLIGLVQQMQEILFYCLLGSLMFGGIFGGIVSLIFTRPIVNLAKKVRNNNPFLVPVLERTGLKELDELAAAIENGSKNFLEHTVKMSQILDLVNMPIGAFECKKELLQVLTTYRLKEILDLTEEETKELYEDRNKFIEKLNDITSHPVDKHNQVYKIKNNPNKWIKINIVTKEDVTLGIAIDVTEEYEEKEKLRRERDYDALTGLCSRRTFRQKVTEIMEQGDLKVAAMIMLDLDYFKLINDNYGHACGDIYLKTIARYLLEISSNGCITGRRSGDEFFMFLFDFQSKKEILNLMESFYQILEDNPMTFPDGMQRAIGISSGIVWYEKYIMQYDALLEAADAALYRAKKSKKGGLSE